MYMISSNLLLLFNINYIKSWIYSNLMEIGFYLNKRKIEKNNCRKYDLNLRLSSYKHDALASMAIEIGISEFNIQSSIVTFNVLKVGQSRAIIDRFCQDEGFELTYYIETLIILLISHLQTINLKTVMTQLCSSQNLSKLQQRKLYCAILSK